MLIREAELEKHLRMINQTEDELQKIYKATLSRRNALRAEVGALYLQS